MLRLASTKITLNSRDLNWHADRHDDRQHRRARGQSIDFISSSILDQGNEGHPQSTIPHRFSRRPLSKQNVASNSPLDSIISRDPVPQGQDSFWDGVIADSQIVPKIRPQDLARHPLIVEHSESFLKHHGSSKGSVQGSSNKSNDLGYSGDGSTSSLDREATVEELQAAAEKQYALAVQSDDGNPNRTSPCGDIAPHVLGRRHRSIFSFHHRKSHETPSEDPMQTVQARFSSQMDLDGSSDTVWARRRHWTRSSTAEDPMQFGFDPRDQRDRGIESSASEAVMVPEASTDGSLSPLSEPADEPTSPQLPVPRSVELFRRRSAALPRSPLWISRTETSSSPEKRHRSPTDSSEMNPREISGLLGQPPRRRTKYRACTKTYSYEESEVSFLASDPGTSIDGLPDDSVSDYPPSSPPEIPNDQDFSSSIHQSYSARSTASPQSTNHHRHLPTPVRAPPLRPAPYPPSNTTPFSPPTLPPPFSATPRTVSFDLAFPSSSPYPSPLRSNPPSSPPLTLQSLSSSPNAPPRTPNMVVYNDALPPNTQPQTPVGLPRNGVPAQNPFSRSIAYYTAPARYGRTPSFRRDANETPTRTRRVRRPRGWEDQENTSEAEEVERRLAREGGRGDGGERRGWLEGTPEPERGRLFLG